jgi:hypothetical protein
MPRKPDAIPGGSTGPNSAYRKRSRKPTAIPGGGGGAWLGTTSASSPKYQKRNITWAKRHSNDDASQRILSVSRKPDARVFRQDILAGEANVKMSTMAAGLTHGEIPNYDGAQRTIAGTSVFDPVLCELAYRWFCPPGGQVLDPFAGGSVRGIVAGRLGRRYLGVDLRPEQVDANRLQMPAICSAPPYPEWIEGDSRDVERIVPNGFAADFVFSCPPYFDLELYSDDPRDLSNMPYPEFLALYRQIIAASVRLLKPDRFACFVVGDMRDKKGIYRGFPWHTVQAFQDAGAGLYNEAVLVTAVGSLPIRVGAAFEKGRKLGKTHQNVLVFVKGDSVAATKAIGPVEFGDPLAAAAIEAAAAGPA